jgi:hypothetical protein
VVATCLYLVLVHAGMAAMASREAFSLKPFMVVYNIYQAVLNTVSVGAAIYFVYRNAWPVWGTPLEYDTQRGFELAFLVWVHYINKYVELLDTTFMVLRKKNKQVTFLHMYHHVLLIWSWFLVCRLCMCVGDAYFGATVNSFIHILMYTYYGLTLVGFKVPLGIKKSLTMAQQIQFATCALHAIYCVVSGYLVVCALIQLFVMTNMLVLFSNFYSKAYKKGGKGKGGSKKGTAEAEAIEGNTPVAKRTRSSRKARKAD